MDVYTTNPDTGEQDRRTLVGDEMPCQIGVFCDDSRCEVVAKNDYVVRESMSSAERLELARTYLRTQGWVCGPDGDFCPNCHF